MAKRRLGDRRDGRLLRDLDSMHFIMPLIYPNRCDNEAFVSERIELSAAEKYLQERNAGGREDEYKIFQLIVAAVLKTLTLRPKMNRFIANGNTYERNYISAAFVIKKKFSDHSEEGLAIIRGEADDTIDTIHDKIYRKINAVRGETERDSTGDAMDLFNKMPRFISKTLVKLVCVLDCYGKVPQSFIASDPYYATAVLTNLGSIKLHSGYHHLTNWGTNSMFVVVGEKKERPFFDEDGNADMRMSIDLGLTVDERIADGYYFSKTIRLLKKLIENPELLEKPLSEEVDY